MCDVSLCFCVFSYGISGMVWYLIISIPDLCLLIYFFVFFRERSGSVVECLT